VAKLTKELLLGSGLNWVIGCQLDVAYWIFLGYSWRWRKLTKRVLLGCGLLDMAESLVPWIFIGCGLNSVRSCYLDVAY